MFKEGYRALLRACARMDIQPLPPWPGSAPNLYDLLELFHGPFLQLPDLSHGFIKAGHLGRQFLLFLGELKEPKERPHSMAQFPPQQAVFLS